MNTVPPPSESHSGMRVLRFLRSDHPESSVLLRVASSDRIASSLDLVATEGENPFTQTGKSYTAKTFAWFPIAKALKSGEPT